MNIDVLFEILLHLPVRSLLRFIVVHKSWYYIVNSPHFRKLYTLRRNNNKDEEVHLYFRSYFFTGGTQVSINLLDNRKSLISYDFRHIDQSVRSGEVKLLCYISSRGLVCISSRDELGITICNPFLGQFKILPLPSLHCRRYHHFDHHHEGLGFDENYKVVQLLSNHHSLHANLYSAKTNSWSELDNIDQDLVIENPIKSVGKNGSFSHWVGYTRSENKKIILSFDMKNEVFRTTSISLLGDEVFYDSRGFRVLAKSDYSFVVLVFDRQRLKVYESSGEGSELVWNNVSNVELKPFWRRKILKMDDIPIWRNDDCVVVRGSKFGEVILYDYHARKFIRRFNIHSSIHGDDIIEYEGSLISP
ncbi:putative F-box protein At3g16210 [Salvia hispanica]|uniref:putative F-box protein At3g16210 n=1 Tax=Salvia hispanica TaxID=49212 RepID=UPI00200979ED|nr:putative F-box protein At3g16210 [Salvia hispanica]